MTAARSWLAVLLAGVALSIWQWNELREEPEHHDGHTHLHDEHGKPARLYDWNVADVTQVILSSPQARITMGREPDGWRGASATDFDVAGFVKLFSQLRSERQLTPIAGQPYGLAPPHLRIALQDVQGNALALMDVGDLAPDGFSRYVQVPGEPNLRMVPDYQVREPLAAMQRSAASGQGNHLKP